MVRKYVDSGTGKIRGPTNRYDWAEGVGNPGDDIQPVGTDNQPGTNDEMARDDHVHQGLSNIRPDPGDPMFGDVILTPGPNMDIENWPPPPGTNGGIRISRLLPDYGILYYDGGLCGSEEFLTLVTGPCEEGMNPIMNLSEGASYGMSLNGMLGTITLQDKWGIYLVKFDLFAQFQLSEPPIKWKAGVYVGDVPTFIRARASAETEGEWVRLCAHGLIYLDLGESLLLKMTHTNEEPNPAWAHIYHLQFSAELIDSIP